MGDGAATMEAPFYGDVADGQALDRYRTLVAIGGLVIVGYLLGQYGYYRKDESGR